MSIFTSVPDYLNWIHESIQTGAKQAGKTYGMSMIVVMGIIMPVSMIAVVTLTISHFIRRKREKGQQPEFVQRAQKHSNDPDFLKKARERSDTDYSGKGGRPEPEFVRKAREQQKKGGN